MNNIGSEALASPNSGTKVPPPNKTNGTDTLVSDNGWRECKLGDVATRMTSGGTPSTSKSEYYDGNIPWLNTKEIKNCRVFETEKTITDLGLQNSSAKWIDKNSVIVAMYGATAGKVAINKIPLTTNQACCNITLDSTQADYNFIYYLLLNSFDRLDNMTSGAAQQNLNVGLISNFEISLPPFDEQKAIAEVLSSLDDKIDLLHRQNRTLESLAQTLFRQWFIEEAKDEWEEKPLGDVIETTSGGTPSRSRMEYYDNGTIPWVKSKELSGSYILTTEEKITEIALKSSSAKLLPKNSILIAMYGATVGEYAIIENEMTCNQAICALKPNKDYPYTFLFMYIKNYKDEIINMAVGSAQQNISQQLIKTLPVPNCTDTINEFHKKIEPTFEKIKSNIKQIQTLENLRDTLLPKLLSGEVRVEI